MEFEIFLFDFEKIELELGLVDDLVLIFEDILFIPIRCS